MRAIVAFRVLAVIASSCGYAVESMRQDPFLAERSCQEFEAEIPALSGWLLADCIRIWNAWAPTVPTGIPREYNDADIMDRTRAQHGELDFRCLVRSVDYPDGAGSAALRHFTTWVRRSVPSIIRAAD